MAATVSEAERGRVNVRSKGRPQKLAQDQVDVLVELVREDPLLSYDDLVWAFRRRTGVAISAPTVRKYLLAAGFERSRPGRQRGGAERAHETSGVGQPGEPDDQVSAKVYGYTEAHRDPGDAVRYPSGLTDTEWEEVKDLFDPAGRTGRPPKYSRRQMLDACVYVLRSGCSWRMLPKDFPAWHAVYRTFRRWLAADLFEHMYDRLRRLWRSRERRDPEPTAAILDSQSVKTSPQGGPKGYDAAKKVKGRKRHLVTDTLGLIIAVLVTEACVQDRDAAMPVVDQAKNKVPGIEKLYVDAGYAGTRVREIREKRDIDVEVVRHPSNRNVGRWHHRQLPLFEDPRKTPSKAFVVLPKRWVIERTNAWNDRPRRMNKDHDRLLSVSTGWIWLAEARRLLRRLTTAA